MLIQHNIENLLFSLIYIILLAATIVQVIIWIGLFGWLALYKEPLLDEENRQRNTQKPVSVIICARNEAKNLINNIPHFLKQNYRSFEIIVVNDDSFDETFQVLFEFQQKSPIFRIVNVNGTKTLPGKKAALTKGIEAAIYEQILLTDADCIPSSPHWIEIMQSKLSPEISIVLGYSPYLDIPSFLNIFIRFETTYTAIQYMAMALAGMPYMGVGRNLLYTRSTFYRGGKFEKHQHIASGDDDLLINTVANRSNTVINLHPSTFIFSRPKHTWRGYYRQKSRHLSTGIEYRMKHKLVLGMISTSHFLHYACAFVLLFDAGYHGHIIFSYLVRIGIVMTVYRLILVKLGDTKLWKWLPLLDILLVIYYIVFAPSLIGKKQKWK